MSLLKDLFSKEKGESMKDIDANKIYECLKEATRKPVIRFHVRKKETGLLDSKIAGSYYIPKGMGIPVNEKTGKELYLLAQLNFAKLPPLEDFPAKGILQLFIAGDDDVYGVDFDDPCKQASWQVRYFEQVPEVVEDEEIHEPIYEADTSLPYPNDSSYALYGVLDQQMITLTDYRFDEYFKTCCINELPSDITKFYDLDEKTRDTLFELIENLDCQVGGYPYFTQADPRGYGDLEKDYEILLFQLDMVEDIMWGDSGVGNFFIKKEDLLKKDFSHVSYHWDCC